MKKHLQKQTVLINSKIEKLKQLIFISILFLICNVNYSQVSPTSETFYTPSGIFDNVFDKDGNIYKLSDITAGKNYVSKNGATTSNTLLCTSGIFELYFETACGMENTTIVLHNQRRAILCQAFQDISNFINTPLKNAGNTNKVKIWIRSPASLSLPANAGGGASAFYNIPLDGVISSIGAPTRGIVDNEIWKTIHTGKDSFNNTVFPIISTQNNTGFYHGWACFNFAGTVNWNLDYNKYNSSTAYPLNYIDFYSTIIHEITHALGFNSLVNYNGESNLLTNLNGLRFGRYFTRYDKNLKTSSNLSLITNIPTTGGQMYDFSFNSGVPSNSLYPNCSLTPPVFNGNSGAFNCTTSLKYVGSTTVPVYNSPCFENGSSLSHFEDACYMGNSNDQYFMMSERASGLFAKRTLTTEERQVLCDIGYSVNGTFGNTSNFTYKNYGVTTCSGITVAGVNDGFTTTGTYAFQGNSGTDITISGILNNDYTGGIQSNLRFEFVQDLYDPNAIFSATTGSNTFTIKSYVPGLHLLRYVPFDNITNQRGNITYIYVNVLNNCAINNPCSLVKNGNFEDHNYAPNNHSQIYKACGWQNASYQTSSEYFNSDATNAYYGIPSNIYGNQTDKIAGNQAYAGMFIEPNRPPLLESVYSEPIKTELLNSLLPNTQYQLTFDVSMADNYLTNKIKFQAFITDTNLELTTGGIIPISNITSDKVFLTNPTFSGSTSANVWETITFTFTTGSNTNLKYLYIGGLNNVQFQGSGRNYYYLDNVSLTIVSPANFLVATNDDFSNLPINSSIGGITNSVYTNDIYNGLPSTSASLSNVTFQLLTPLSISGASINSSGYITVPTGTPAGTYSLTYKINVIGNCSSPSTATVIILVTGSTPNIVAGIRANEAVLKIGLQSSGKSIITGNFTAYNNIARKGIARLNTDVTLDTNFSSSGPTTNITGYPVQDFDIQSDDKIIVVGRFSGFSGGSNGANIARLLPDGSIDTTFNSGGTGITGVVGTNSNVVSAIKVLSNGYILAGGDFNWYNGVQRNGLVKIKPDGSIDTTFSMPVLAGYKNTITDIAIQPDGKILLIGYFFMPPNGIYRSLIRLLSDGSIDTSFTTGDLTGSISHTQIGVGGYPLSKVKLQPDGKIIVCGAFTKYNGTTVNCIVRLLSNGVVDSSFITTTGVNRKILEVMMEASTNKLIIGGEFDMFGSTAIKKMIRLNTNGSIDNTFSIGSGTTHSAPLANCPYCKNNILALKQQSDGKILVGGRFTTFNGLSATNITRIFGNSGLQSRVFGNSGVQANDSFNEYKSEPEIDTNTYSNIIVYPNPSDGIYYFNLVDESNNTELNIFNFLGEQVFTSLLLGSQENKINLSHLAKGCYLVKLSNIENTTTRKIIKN